MAWARIDSRLVEGCAGIKMLSSCTRRNFGEMSEMIRRRGATMPFDKSIHQVTLATPERSFDTELAA